MFEKVLWAFEKGLAGKKMPAGTRLGTTVLNKKKLSCTNKKLRMMHLSNDKKIYLDNYKSLTYQVYFLKLIIA